MVEKLGVGKTYKLVINVGNDSSLTFTANIISIDSNFIHFKDKFGELKHYNLSSIISYEEIKTT